VRKGSGLEGLDFATDSWFESIYEATQEKLVRKAWDAVCKSFKGGLIVFESSGLAEFEKGTSRIIKMGRSKPKFKGVEEHRPRKELVVWMHPLIPSESFFFHVKRSNFEPLFINIVVKIKKLVNFEDPT